MCWLVFCNSDKEDVRVNETMDDGSWSVYICQDCADKLSIKEGGELPDYQTTKKLLGKTK